MIPGIKIISGAQTGVDRAALDVAIALNIDYGGAIPKGRIAEDGPIDLKYNKLTELKTSNYQIRTEENAKDGDATIVFTIGEPTGGTAFTIKCLKKHKKPYMLIDLEKEDSEIIEQINKWLTQSNPGKLNIAGPRESKFPGIYKRTYTILKHVFA